MTQKKLRFYQRYYIINMRLQVAILLYSVLFAAFINVANETYRYIETNNMNAVLGLNVRIWFWIFNVVLIYFIVLFGFYFTNRIAGPIFRLQKHIEKVVEGGEVTPFSIRKNDYFHELLGCYNQLLEQIKEMKKKTK